MKDLIFKIALILLSFSLSIIYKFKKKLRERRVKKALRELTKISQEMGLYDMDPGYNPLIKNNQNDSTKK